MIIFFYLTKFYVKKINTRTKQTFSPPENFSQTTVHTFCKVGNAFFHFNQEVTPEYIALHSDRLLTLQTIFSIPADLGNNVTAPSVSTDKNEEKVVERKMKEFKMPFCNEVEMMKNHKSKKTDNNTSFFIVQFQVTKQYNNNVQFEAIVAI